MIPLLPGFRSSCATARTINQSLRIKHGYMLVQPGVQRPVTAPSQLAASSLASVRATSPIRDAGDYHDLKGRYSISSQQRDRSSSSKELPFNDEASLPSFIKYDRKVLCFKAYYEENVHGSTIERQRVRKCLIYYYLEDDTIQMTEPTEGNSGIPQGQFIRRHRLPKPEYQLGDEAKAEDDFYAARDLYIGAEIEVYKKRIKVYDCDAFTQHYISQFAERRECVGDDDDEASRVSALSTMTTTAALPCPEGEYNKIQRIRMQRETGADQRIKRNRRMHPMKSFMEAQLGKPQSVADLGSFLAHDRQVLRFECVWDDSSRLYGDVLKFKLHYYLSDDTIEILNEKTNGRDLVPKLLNRRKLPLPSAQELMQATGPLGVIDESTAQSYHWKDLELGKQIEVFNRQLLLVDADPFTFRYYAKEHRPLGKPIKLDDGGFPLELVQTSIPPYNGFGSEEDSLRTVYSIRPKKPTRDNSKPENFGNVMRFSIRMANARKEDEARVFILQFYLIDDTLSIRETVLRNSGHGGGGFLRRGRIRKPPHLQPTTSAAVPTASTGIWGPPPVVAYYEASDLYVGAVLEFLGHNFIIYDADEHSLRYMESKGAPMFPHSDLASIHAAAKQDPSNRGRLNLAMTDATFENAQQLKDIMEEAGLSLPHQASITLARAARERESHPREKGSFSGTTVATLLIGCC
ncbi:hypothetical protein CTAYLR_006046 [Chrysophaeum taylorii]|uniref:DM10 domain-containing protein n=1 Tax=Chrysophaeum taylorii TaxID=2483200 RepID=A0AAD7XNL2_9STRA|nr:hypothetical protein CTAYLR_006046 [Chrysophaeum taylorii]